MPPILLRLIWWFRNDLWSFLKPLVTSRTFWIVAVVISYFAFAYLTFQQRYWKRHYKALYTTESRAKASSNRANDSLRTIINYAQFKIDSSKTKGAAAVAQDSIAASALSDVELISDVDSLLAKLRANREKALRTN